MSLAFLPALGTAALNFQLVDLFLHVRELALYVREFVIHHALLHLEALEEVSDRVGLCINVLVLLLDFGVNVA